MCTTKFQSGISLHVFCKKHKDLEAVLSFLKSYDFEFSEFHISFLKDP